MIIHSRSILNQLKNISWNWISLNDFIENSIEIFWPHCTSALHCTRARCFHTLESFACWNFGKNVSRERSCLVLSSSSSENMLFDPIQCCYMYVFVFFLLQSSPCMLYVYAIYVHVCILTTTYNVIRVSKTYLAVTNNARWSIRSSNWWENAQVRLGYALNYVFIRNHIMKSKKIITWALYKRLICFSRNIMSENANEWRWMRKDRY